MNLLAKRWMSQLAGGLDSHLNVAGSHAYATRLSLLLGISPASVIAIRSQAASVYASGGHACGRCVTLHALPFRKRPQSQ